jgi:hypothetical protein
MRLIFMSLAGAAAVMATSALLSLTASAERVCRQECAAGVCKEQCVETTERERERVIIEDRGERREEKREEKREPGVELKAPGVGVEIGR